MDFAEYSLERSESIESYLKQVFQGLRKKNSLRLTPLVEAMEYSVFSQGKRFRPLLSVAAAECLGIPVPSILPLAGALECIHTYSLIHDDLPALDNDDMRRGKPSNHRKFGEATAILAGDALLTEAFSLLTDLADIEVFREKAVLETIRSLSQMAGVGGLVGGQFLDISLDGEPGLPEIEFIHIHKTGALILASVVLPAKLAGASPERLERFKKYGEAVGLAFQISDDLLDGADPKATWGKKMRPSYLQYESRTEIQERLNTLVATAIAQVEKEGEKAQGMVALAGLLKNRRK